MTTHTYTTELTWGGDEPTAEIEVEVEFDVDWGRPATGPTYACGGEPAEPAEITNIRVVLVDGKPRPWGLHDGFLSDKELEDEIINKLDEEDMLVSAELEGDW